NVHGLERDYIVLVFFFQAEDGIRDLYVTGVQTCCSSDLLSAVGTMKGSRIAPRMRRLNRTSRNSSSASAIPRTVLSVSAAAVNRSEERRVGKEWRCRWAAED